jgi:integrase
VPTNAPWRGVVPFHLPKAQITYLTDVEARRLVNATEGRFRDLVRAGLMTGGRCGELARLRVMDYDPAAGNIFIAESKGGESRHVPLGREGRAFFDARTAGKARDALVFIPEEGDHWGRSLQTARMKEACTRAGIRPAVTFHALRHTHASLLASAGVPLKVIATLLGHSSVSVTEKHYAHLMPSAARAAVEAHLPVFSDLEDKVVNIGR